MKIKKRIKVAVCTALAVMVVSVPALGMTHYGYYGITGFNVGIRVWAYESSEYTSASGKIVEGSYNSGWKTGRDVTITKTNNIFHTCYGYHKYNR